MARTLIPLAAALLLPTLTLPTPSAAQSTGETADPASAINAYVEPYLSSGHLSGGLLVARGDEVIYERYWGDARAEGSPIEPETVLPVASVSKPLTVIIASGLRDSGELDWAAPIAKYLSDFPRGEDIQVRHLLFHRSGLPHRILEREQEKRPWTTEEFLTRAAQAGLQFEPNRDRLYSSTGYAVLARVLEAASGKSYDALLREFVLEPLKLEHTYHHSADMSLDVLPSSYRFAVDAPETRPEDTPPASTLVPLDKIHLSFLVGAGSVLSSPRELLSIQQALLAGELGETAQRNLVRQGELEWNGFTNGFRAFADYHAVAELHVILVSNLLVGAHDRLRSAIPQLVAGEEVEAGAPPAPALTRVAPGDLERWVGAYGDAGNPLRVYNRGDYLLVNEWLLLPTAADTFYSPQDYGTVTFVVDADGEVIRMDWRRGEQVTPFPRVSP